MKILLVHNYYGSSAPSGENLVFEAERELLRARGHKVETALRHSDTIRNQGLRGKITGAVAVPWNPFAARSISRQVADFRPDVVHVHNTFPLWSPAIFHAIGTRAARVLTLHNYRIACAAGIPMREGKVCTACIDAQSALPGLRHGCYRNSHLATIPLAAGIALHRRIGTWQKHVDAFIALSEFQRAKMVAAGLPGSKMHVKPNFYPGRPVVKRWGDRQDRAVCVGRVSEEKGVSELVSAWLEWGDQAPELLIVGDGPLRRRLEERVAAERCSSVQFTGQLSADEAQACIATSKLLVLPSKWFEGFPMSLREAFAFGTPSLVSDIGPLPDLVGHGESGAVSPPGDSRSLLAVVSSLWHDEDRLRRMSRMARAEFDQKYTEDSNYAILLGIYEAALEQIGRGPLPGEQVS